MTAAFEFQHPGLPVPPPLRGAEEGTFTHYSVAVRPVGIARRVPAENALAAAAEANRQALIREIPEGPVRPLRDAEAPDADAWARYVAPHVGQNLLQVPWFFAEAYFYRRILEATGFFQPDEGYGADPFAYQKRQGLETTRAAIWALGLQLSAQMGRAGRSPGGPSAAVHGRPLGQSGRPEPLVRRGGWAASPPTWEFSRLTCWWTTPCTPPTTSPGSAGQPSESIFWWTAQASSS